MMALTSGDLIVIRGDLIIDRYGGGGGRSDARSARGELRDHRPRGYRFAGEKE